MKRQRAKETAPPGSARKMIKFLSSAILVVLFVAMILFLIYVDRVLKDEHVPQYVSFLGENLGGMKLDKAAQRIRDIAGSLSGRSLFIRYGERVWKLQPDKDIDFRVEQESVVERLRRIGNSGNLLSRLRERLRLHTGRDRIELGARCFYNKEKLHHFAELLVLNINRAAEPARVAEETPFKRLIREKPGVETTSRDISRQLFAALETVTSYRTVVCQLEVGQRAAEPDFSAKIKQLGCSPVSRVVLPLPEDPERQRRITRAAELLDGLILTGSDNFSLQQVLQSSRQKDLPDDDREQKNGFFPDPTGLGQLATALYQGAVMAGMDVIERHAHRHVNMEFRYTEPGRDAIVDFSDKDLKIRNRRKANAVFSMILKEKSLILTIYSSEPVPGVVDFVSRNFQQLDCPENVFLDGSRIRGQRDVIRPGLAGVKVDTDRRWKQGEKEELLPLSHDEYEAIPRDVRVGDKTP